MGGGYSRKICWGGSSSLPPSHFPDAAGRGTLKSAPSYQKPAKDPTWDLA